MNQSNLFLVHAVVTICDDYIYICYMVFLPNSFAEGALHKNYLWQSSIKNTSSPIQMPALSLSFVVKQACPDVVLPKRMSHNARPDRVKKGRSFVLFGFAQLLQHTEHVIACAQ